MDSAVEQEAESVVVVEVPESEPAESRGGCNACSVDLLEGVRAGSSAHAHCAGEKPHRVMWISGLTFPEIAAALGRDRSTVWREVRRNHSHTHGFKHAGRVKGQALRSVAGRRHGLYRWGYDAAAAQQRASSRTCRPRQVKLGYRPSVRTTARQYRPRGTASAGWGSGFARGMPTRLADGRVGQAASPVVPATDLVLACSHFAPDTRSCRCRTRRSIRRCTCSLGATCGASSATRQCPASGRAIWSATRRHVAERRWKDSAAALSQPRSEAGGSLNWGAPVRIW